MRTLVLLACLAVSGAAAQAQTTILPAVFPPQLKSYLGLSEAQVSSITAINLRLTMFQATKAQRQAQVNSEIAEEVAKSSPDPMALGLRYVELEAIRRELDAMQKKTLQDIQAVLTADQRVKVSALQQALLLYSTACSAVQVNLLAAPALGMGSGYAQVLLGVPSLLLPTTLSPCGSSTTLPIIFTPGVSPNNSRD